MPDKILGEGDKLLSDAYSEWLMVGHWAMSLQAGHPHEDPKLPRHYAVRFRDMETKGYPKGMCDDILRESDPAAVAQFDALVDEFHTRAVEIIEAKDVETALEFVRRAKAIVFGK